MLDKFKIYPKLDYTNFSKEFEDEVHSAKGIEIQFFDENGYMSNIDIRKRIDMILGVYPNIKEVTVHTPLDNYLIEQILFKDETILENQLKDAVDISKEKNITVNILYHTEWNTLQLEESGVLDKLRKYLKILEGSNSKLLLENLYLLNEKACTVLEVCEKIDHPNLKVCIDTTHIKVRATIWKKNLLDFVKEYLDKDLCEKYVHQIHFATALNNDGYIVKKTHGRAHENNDTLDFDLKWMKDRNLLNKIFVTEVSEDDYRERPDQLREIKMLREEIKKYIE